MVGGLILLAAPAAAEASVWRCLAAQSCSTAGPGTCKPQSVNYQLTRDGDQLVLFRPDAALERRLDIVSDSPGLTAFGFPPDLDGRPMVLNLSKAGDGFAFTVHLASNIPDSPLIAISVRGTCERTQ